eukprot:tig00020851_g14723.t1
MALVAQFNVEEYTTLLMKLADDGLSFTLISCIKTHVGHTAGIITFAAGRLNSDTVVVPEWAAFWAAISPSGRALAYTFFGKHDECDIWVTRRAMGSMVVKRDQLHQHKRENVRPKYFTCCLTFGIFEYEAMDEDLDENGEICFNYCRLLRNISLECRKGDCFQHIMLNPAKNEITLYAVASPSARFRLSNIRVAVIEALPSPVS